MPRRFAVRMIALFAAFGLVLSQSQTARAEANTLRVAKQKTA